MKLEVKYSQDQITEQEPAAYINQTGIYDVTINFASIESANKGDSKAEQIVFNLDYENKAQTFYGLWVQKRDGTESESGCKVINRLAIIAGIEEGQTLSVEKQTHPLGKDKVPTELNILTDFSGLKCKVRVQKVYSKYKEKINTKYLIKTFYTDEGASAEELVNKLPRGVQLEKDLAYATADKVTYEDGLTEAEVKRGLESQKGGNATTPEVANKPKSDLFSKN